MDDQSLNQHQRSPDKAQEMAGQLLREFAVLEGRRGIWEKHWEEVAQKVLPYYSTSF